MGKWNSNSTSIFRFSFSHDIEKQIWILLFVFRFRLTLKNAFELRFSFFVFVSLWKTDMNFVFLFHITLKNGFEFRFSFSHHFNKRIRISFLYGLLFEKQIWISFVVIARLLKNGLLHQSFEVPGHPLGVYRGIHFLCKGKQLNFLLPGAKVSGELPRPRDMFPTHGTPF